MMMMMMMNSEERLVVLLVLILLAVMVAQTMGIPKKPPAHQVTAWSMALHRTFGAVVAVVVHHWNLLWNSGGCPFEEVQITHQQLGKSKVWNQLSQQFCAKPVPNSGVQKQLTESKFQAGWVEVGRNGLNLGKSKESRLCPIYAWMNAWILWKLVFSGRIMEDPKFRLVAFQSYWIVAGLSSWTVDPWIHRRVEVALQAWKQHCRFILRSTEAQSPLVFFFKSWTPESRTSLYNVKQLHHVMHLLFFRWKRISIVQDATRPKRRHWAMGFRDQPF